MFGVVIKYDDQRCNDCNIFDVYMYGANCNVMIYIITNFTFVMID